jgi:2,5-diketo-D-gluconate reductase A
MTASPLLTLNNGVKMPALGFGTLDRTTPERITAAVEAATAKGCRLIDTAASYAVERQAGEGIRRGGIARSGLFVTTKLWISDYGHEQALRACDVSLRKLGLDYVDLYLLHWPVPSDFGATVASFQAVEKLLADGRVRAIGVSNFSPKHMQNLIERTQVRPAVNQVELHPFFIQQQMWDANARHGHRHPTMVANRRRLPEEPDRRARPARPPLALLRSRPFTAGPRRRSCSAGTFSMGSR